MKLHESAYCRTKRHAIASKFMAVAASMLLIASLMPISTASGATASSSQSSDGSWVETIDEMLDAGDYVEGEALVILAVGGGAGLVSADDEGSTASADVLGGCEELMAVSASTAASTLNAAAVNNAISAAEGADAGIGAASADDVAQAASTAIVLAHQEGMTTKELLEALANDPRVVSANPNYIGSVDDETTTADSADAAAVIQEETASAALESNNPETSTVASVDAAAGSQAGTQNGSANAAVKNGSSEVISASKDATTFQPGESKQISADDIPDLTGYQWANAGCDANVLSGSKNPIDANIPNWNTGTQNSAGVIAVVDTGIDYTHPDLAGVMFDMSNYMGTIGGGEYGYCATSASEDDPIDEYGHGTHCAGIIAAECNGKGTTGAANGAKLLACRAAGKSGSLLTSDIIKCYSYLSRAIDAGVDIRAINNSWGGTASSSYALAVSELGQKGAISVIASGNDGLDNDGRAVTSTFATMNSYAVVVNSSSIDGKASSYSNYGKETTSFYAPGATIMSTYPQSFSNYLPSYVEMSQNASNVAYDTFDGNGSIEMYAGFGANAITEENKITADGGNYHFDETGSLSVTGSQLKATDLGAQGKYTHRYGLTFKVPVSKNELARVSCFGISATSTSSARIIAVAAAEVKGDDGGVTVVADDNQKSALVNTASWSNLSASFGKTISNAAQGIEGASLVWYSDGTFDENGNENGYIAVPVEIALPATSKLELADDDVVYIDCAGLGNTTMPYEMMCGTSMAAPLATGAASICSTTIDQSENPSDRAIELASLLKSCTTQYDQFAGTCTSNGTLDLSKLKNREEATPAISAVTLVEGDQNYLDISGLAFGSTGTVSIDGQNAEVVSWQDSAVRVKVPNGVLSGKHVVTVSNAAGAGSRATVLRFTQNPPENDTVLYEEKIEITDKTLANSATRTTMVGLDDSIYVILDEKDAVDETGTTTILSVKNFYRYDTKSGEWTDLGTLPTYMDAASGEETTGFISVSTTLWEGKILVLGRGGGANGLFSTQCLFSYDPNTAEWTELTSIEKNIPMGASIVNANGTLVAIGGMAKWPSSVEDLETSDTENNIWKIDMGTGERTSIGTLVYPRSNYISMFSIPMQVAASGDTIYVTGGVGAKQNSLVDNNQPAERLVKQEDGTYIAEDVSKLLPAMHSEYDETYGLATGTNGAAYCGLKADKGSDDTYLLENGGTSTYAFERKFSDVACSGVTALAYHGKLYAFGVDELSGGTSVMRATAFDTPEHPAGELESTNPDPTPDPTPTPAPGTSNTNDNNSTEVVKQASDEPAAGASAKTDDAAAGATAAAFACLGAAAAVAAIARRRSKQLR